MPTVSDATHEFTGIVNLQAATTVHHKAGSVTNADLATNRIEDYFTDFHVDVDATPVAKSPAVTICRAAGTIKYVYFALDDTGSTTDIDYDCKKNGTTVLSGVVNFTNSDSDGTNKAGTLAVTTVAAGDRISMDVAITTSTGALGPMGVIGIEYTATKA